MRINEKYDPVYHSCIVRNYRRLFAERCGYETRLTDEQVFRAWLTAYDYSNSLDTDENTLTEMSEIE